MLFNSVDRAVGLVALVLWSSNLGRGIAAGANIEKNRHNAGTGWVGRFKPVPAALPKP